VGEIMDKKQFYYVIICALVFTISVVSIIVDYNTTVCHAKGCNNDKTYGSEYCRDHTCSMRNCNNIKNENSKYCPEHEEELRLERERILAEEAKKTDCIYSGCKYKAEIGHSYCFLHECAASNCDKCVVVGGMFCRTHTCSEAGCTRRATEKSGRCYTCEKETASKKNSSKKTTTYKSKSKSKEVEWPDCDDYEDFDHYMDDWEGDMQDGSNAEDYWDDW